MKERNHRKWIWLSAGILVLLLLVGLMVPGFRSGTAAVLNRVYEISESRNAYLYERLPGSDPAWFFPALMLLFAIALVFFLTLALFSRPLAGTIVLACLALGQAYFGIAFPAAVNVLLFLCGMFLLIRPFAGLRDGAFVLSVLLPVCLLVALFLPGTDPAVEQLSEQVRDWFGRSSEPGESGGAMPEAMVETRHVNERSLDVGDREARGTEEYRLIQLERMEISRPDWFNLVRLVLPLLGMLLLLIAPFVPFVLLNRRRQITLERRKLFESPDNRIAVAAMFRHVCAYLRATGHMGANAPYRMRLLPGMDSAFSTAFHEAAVIWERTVYSEHPIDSEQRAIVGQLLEDTERRLYEQADRRQQFRLRTVECLHL
ncbi:MAG: hypothetical protein IJ088_12725 [Clostridia bacterium]|nr:hypothetical protein [Clostridia bacterium]